MIDRTPHGVLVEMGFCPNCKDFISSSVSGPRCSPLTKLTCKCGWFAFVDEFPRPENPELSMAA